LHWPHFCLWFINVLKNEELLHAPKLGVINVQLPLYFLIPVLLPYKSICD
jgi:hypothetical protein